VLGVVERSGLLKMEAEPAVEFAFVIIRVPMMP